MKLSTPSLSGCRSDRREPRLDACARDSQVCGRLALRWRVPDEPLDRGAARRGAHSVSSPPPVLRAARRSSLTCRWGDRFPAALPRARPTARPCTAHHPSHPRTGGAQPASQRPGADAQPTAWPPARAPPIRPRQRRRRPFRRSPSAAAAPPFRRSTRQRQRRPSAASARQRRRRPFRRRLGSGGAAHSTCRPRQRRRRPFRRFRPRQRRRRPFHRCRPRNAAGHLPARSAAARRRFHGRPRQAAPPIPPLPPGAAAPPIPPPASAAQPMPPRSPFQHAPAPAGRGGRHNAGYG